MLKLFLTLCTVSLHAAGSCSAASAVTCDECLQLSSLCAWCTQEVSVQAVHVLNQNVSADDTWGTEFRF